MREFIIRYRYISPETKVCLKRVKAENSHDAWNIFLKDQQRFLGKFMKVGKIMPVKFKKGVSNGK